MRRTDPPTSDSLNRNASRVRTALTIAGHDPTGGAGITSDIKTFQHFGVYGLSVVTAITAQNTRGVVLTNPVEVSLLEAQLDALRDDIVFDAIKIGLLGAVDSVDVVAGFVREIGVPVVLDPIVASSNGVSFLDDAALSALKKSLLPHCALITPNLQEASALTGMSVRSDEDMIAAANALHESGAKAVLIKGGHADGEYARDLFSDGASVEWFSSPRREKHVHGTGCLVSAAITSMLAKGYSLRDAIGEAKDFISSMIDAAVPLGAGRPLFLYPQLECSDTAV